MKIRIPFKQFFASLLTCSIVLSLQISAEDDTPLTKTMEESSTALKTLRKMDPNDWAAGAEAARKAADGIRKGMEYDPALAKDMKEGDKKIMFLAKYRRAMGESYVLLCELELAYLEKDKEKVDAVIAKVKESRKLGHREYKED